MLMPFGSNTFLATPTCDLIGRERGFLVIVLCVLLSQSCVKVSFKEGIPTALSNLNAFLELGDTIVVCHWVSDLRSNHRCRRGSLPLGTRHHHHLLWLLLCRLRSLPADLGAPV